MSGPGGAPRAKRALQRRLSGDYEVDLWGGDADWVDTLAALSTAFLRVHIDGLRHLPVDGPVVMVGNRRLGLGEPVAVSVGIRRAAGRMVRPVGVPDFAPVGPILRRLGGVPESPAEIRSLLAAGQLVLVPLTAQRRAGVAGTVSPDLLAPALETGAVVLPVAVVGGELSGAWRIAIGEPLARVSHLRRTPLAAAELADRAHAGVQGLLDDVFPPRWSLG